MDVVYLDNAATSWPKPPEVQMAMGRFLEEGAGNPGRSGHRLSIEAGRLVATAREAVCELVGSPDPLRVVFGANATWALNQATVGILKPGDHVITSSVEHNSVMRPLRYLAESGVIGLSIVPCTKNGTLDSADVEAAVRAETRLLVFTHASNVTGTLLPIARLGRIARKHDKLLLVDGAATLGNVPFDMERSEVDLLAFTGHKSLLGPTGTGGLVVGDRVDVGKLNPLIRGGTGSRSDGEVQPDFLPDALESGTVNATGLAGLKAGICWVRERGVEGIRSHHLRLSDALIEGLSEIKGVTVHGALERELRTGIVSFSLGDMSVSRAGSILDLEFGVLCRVGLHCAPSAHRSIGTFPAGTVRFAPGVFTTPGDIETALRAVASLGRTPLRD